MAKTTIVLSNELYGAVKERAKAEGRTLSWYIHKGLGRVLEDDKHSE